MEQNFEVSYNGKQVKVTREDHNHFVAHVDGKELKLHMKQDNEGANQWFESDTEKATDEVNEIGSSIDTYLADKEKII